jgi:predicted AlkP superfamily pyrophosphatase or phosphodiesterase
MRRLFLTILVAAALLPSLATAATKYFIEISVDGLGSVYLQPMIDAGKLPNFERFQTDGAWTNNARNDENLTITLPNHTTMVTGRHVKGPSGHQWTKNVDPDKGETLHEHPGYDGPYIASVFDVAHDHGLRTIMVAGKTKFSLYRDSYDEENGAADPGASNPSAIDHGRAKLDRFVYNEDCRKMTNTYVSAMKANPYQYSFIHFADPDTAGHKYGWGSDEYKRAIRRVDAQLGKLFAMIDGDARLRGATTIFLTADHGGLDKDHSNNMLVEVYTIPVYIWGAGTAHGRNLYLLNKSTRLEPGKGHPHATDAVQPVRNGDGANLALKLLGLGPIPGSTINRKQDLSIQ